MSIQICGAPCCWGVDDPKNPYLPPWTRVLEEAGKAGYSAIELGPYGYLPIDADSSQTVGETTVENPVVEPEAVSPKVIARVKIEPGSRLTLISLKYYGSKLFWVYLYEYNRAVITDPNNVPIGTVIEVPAPEMYGIDRRDRSSIEKAAARQTEILSGKL